MDRNLPYQALLERNERLGSHHARDVLNLAVEQFHQVLIVAGIELDHHGVTASGEVNFYNLGNLFELGHDSLVHGTALQCQANESTGGIAQCLGVDNVARTSNDTHINHALDALMNGRARHATLDCNILRRDASIFHNDVQDSLV